MSESKYACTEGDDCCCKHITLTANADVAQPEEQLDSTEQVAGSTPAVGSSPQIMNMIQLRSGRLLTLTGDEVIELHPLLRGLFNR